MDNEAAPTDEAVAAHTVYVDHLRTCESCKHKAAVTSLCEQGQQLHRVAYPVVAVKPHVDDWKYALSLALPDDFPDELLIKIVDAIEPYFAAPTADQRADDEKVAALIADSYVDTEGFLFDRDKLIAAIASALTAARQSVAEQWRPIESAPKDGTKIIIRQVERHAAAYLSRKEMWVSPDGAVGYDNPTHWLPAGPQESQEDGQ